MDDLELKTAVFSSINRYDENTDNRIKWLKSFAQWCNVNRIQGNVAECGVNRGEFAEFINKYFFDRKLYLFDTFRGFEEKDLKFELSIGKSYFERSSFNNQELFQCTNIDIVKRRMKNVEKCEFCIGCFPESAIEVKDEFCFVNLDMDLYQPMLAGIDFFYPQMVSNGVILLHDYFHPDLQGVKRAVDDYEKRTKKRLHKFVIGDYCSLAIVK